LQKSNNIFILEKVLLFIIIINIFNNYNYIIS
jgi:hypothetical protein